MINFGTQVTVTSIGKTGRVTGRAEYANGSWMYYVEFDDPAQSDNWFEAEKIVTPEPITNN